MKRIALLVLVALMLCGCSALSKSKGSSAASEVVEVPDEVWQNVRKKIEERSKVEAAKQDQVPNLKQELEKRLAPLSRQEPTGKKK
jgi:outer membrane murein-binding lipoprotein Lpp